MAWSEEVYQHRSKENAKNRKLEERGVDTDKSAFRDYFAFALVASVVIGLIYMLRPKKAVPKRKPRDPREAAAEAAERRRDMSSSANAGASSGIRTSMSYKDTLLQNLNNLQEKSNK